MNLWSSFSSNRVRFPILTGLTAPSLMRRYKVGLDILKSSKVSFTVMSFSM